MKHKYELLDKNYWNNKFKQDIKSKQHKNIMDLMVVFLVLDAETDVPRS